MSLPQNLKNANLQKIRNAKLQRSASEVGYDLSDDDSDGSDGEK